MLAPSFSADFRERFLDLVTWRRDVRAFRDEPLPAGLLERLIDVACLSPSVGLSEPWRFVLVEDAARREAIRANFKAANAAALASQGASRQALYARLKLAGLEQAPTHLAVFADPMTEQGHDLGRHTMPEAIDHSVAIAIHTLWLAARVEGVGLGWVSILDTGPLTELLDVPEAWRFVGYLCLGYPTGEDSLPTLQRDGWETRRTPASKVFRR